MKNDCEMDSLFAAWSEDRRGSAPLMLREWIARYPDCAEELVQWTADAPVLDYAETQPEESEADARALALGRQVLSDLRTRLAPTATVRRMVSLKETARQVGLNLKGLEIRLGLGRSVMMKLEYRQVRAASVPAALMQRLSEALQVGVEEVRAYLSLSPTLAQGANYSSKGVPQITAQEDFAQAVRTCSDMTEEQKAAWLNSGDA